MESKWKWRMVAWIATAFVMAQWIAIVCFIKYQLWFLPASGLVCSIIAAVEQYTLRPK